MALILKPNKKYNYKGLELSEIYGVVDQVNMNKKDRIAHIVFEIYPNKEARQEPTKLLEQYNYDITSDKFDKWFGVDSLDNNNQFVIAYEYLLQLREVINAEQENEELGDLVWKDLQSDE